MKVALINSRSGRCTGKMEKNKKIPSRVLWTLSKCLSGCPCKRQTESHSRGVSGSTHDGGDRGGVAGGGGMTNVVRRRRYVTPSGEGRKVAGERRRKGGEGCEVSFRPRQQSALSASAASPDRTAGLPHGERHRLRTTVKWALSKNK